MPKARPGRELCQRLGEAVRRECAGTTDEDRERSRSRRPFLLEAPHPGPVVEDWGSLAMLRAWRRKYEVLKVAFHDQISGVEHGHPVDLDVVHGDPGTHNPELQAFRVDDHLGP